MIQPINAAGRANRDPPRYKANKPKKKRNKSPPGRKFNEYIRDANSRRP